MRRKSSLLPCSIQSSCLPQVQQRNLSGLTQDHFLLMQSYWWSQQPSRTAVLHIQGLAFQAAVKLCLLHCAHCRDGVNEQFCAGQLPLPIQKPSSSYSVTRVWSVWSCPLILIPFEHWGGPQKQKLSEFWVLFLHSHTVGSCWPGCISLLRTRPFLSVSVSLHSDICPLLFPNPGNATLLLLDQTVPQFLAVFLKPSPPPLKTFM